MFLTIGCMGFTVEEVEAVMAEKAIRLLIDVRSIPYSRNPTKYCFNRNRLEARMPGRYLWKGDVLGGKPGPASQEGIDWLLAEIPLGPPLLMCMEADPRSCHRYYDIAVRLSRSGVPGVHLFKVDGVIVGRTTLALSLSGDPSKEAL